MYNSHEIVVCGVYLYWHVCCVPVCLYVSVCLCVFACRVNELIQLASSTPTVARVGMTQSQQENVECQESAGLSDNSELIPQSAVTASTQLQAVSSCQIDVLNSTNTNQPLSSVDNTVAAAEPSCTEKDALDSCLVARPPADDGEVLYDEEAVVVGCCKIESQQPAVLLSIQTSDGLPVCATNCAGIVTLINTISSASSATTQVSWVKPPTLLVPSVECVLPVKRTSSSVDELHLVTAADAACDTISVTDNLMVMQSSELPVNSVQIQVQDVQASTASQELMGNILDISSPVSDGGIVPTKEVNDSIDISVALTPTTSVTPNNAVKTVTAAIRCKDVDLANAVNVLTSLRALNKSEWNRPIDKGKAESPCRKRPRRVSTKTGAETAAAAETEEKRIKCAKLDGSLVVSSSATELPVGNKHTSSAAMMTGLTDSQRISCYKTIGAREERSRVIGLKAAERLRRRTCPAEKAAVLGSAGSQSPGPVAGKSADELSKSSPRKPARRVPLLTVSTNLPTTPTVFTLRARARLAQMQQEELQRSLKESNPSTTPTGVFMTSPTEGKGVDVGQVATSSEVHSADPGASVTGQPRESHRSETVQTRGANQVQWNQPHNLSDHMNHKNSRQLRSSHKLSLDVTPSTASSLVTSHLDTSKQKSVATLSANANNKSVVHGKLSSTVSDKTTSVGPKTRNVTVSESDGNISVIVAGGKTGSRSTGNCGKANSAKIVNGGSVQDNPCNPHSVNARNDKKSDADDITKQMSSKTSARNKSEPVKPQQSVMENGAKSKLKKQTILPKETVPSAVAVDAVISVTKDSRSGARQSVKCQNNHTMVLQDVSVERANKVPDAAALQYLVSLATSKPSNSASTSMICNKSLASEKDISRGVDTNIKCQQVVGKTSARTDISQVVLDSSTSVVSEKRLSPQSAKQQVDTSCVSDLAAHPSSPSTGLSSNQRASVDLFDVAIAGTPAQYAVNDDSSDNLLLSPYSNDVADEAVNTACDDAVSAAAEFVVPENPAGEVNDPSLCGKCVLHTRKLASRIQFEFVNSAHTGIFYVFSTQYEFFIYELLILLQYFSCAISVLYRCFL